MLKEVLKVKCYQKSGYLQRKKSSRTGKYMGKNEPA